MKKGFVFLLLGMVLSGCQKMDPQITALLKLPSNDPNPPVNDTSSPKAGRITLGSDSAPVTGSAYRLKGRVSLMESARGTGSQYKLQSTLKF
ncbi:MAG: hypothetical protein KF802_01310 [Bdellovibrionaceae bacterium]|nr:hypothetical protein [Pseudobdellovibrionaceae bacterium]MBX3034341.1 hypothetical protein [Pseudobdellovibrionaceae bacterium]